MTSVKNNTLQMNALTTWLDRKGFKESQRIISIIKGVIKWLIAAAIVVAAYLSIKYLIASYNPTSYHLGVGTALALFFITVFLGPLGIAGIAHFCRGGTMDLIAVSFYKDPSQRDENIFISANL